MTSVSLDVRLVYPVFGSFGFDLLVYEFKLLSSFLGTALRRYCARIRKTMHEEGNLTSFLDDTNISSCRVYQGLRGDIFITPCGWDTVIMVNESSAVFIPYGSVMSVSIHFSLYIFSLDFSLGLKQCWSSVLLWISEWGKTSQAASLPTVLNVAKMHLYANCSLRMSICASIFDLHRS